MSVKKVVLSLAITGHEEEAEKLAFDMEKAVRERFPLAEIFNPVRLPRKKNWEEYMVVCRARVSGWADTIVRGHNKHLGSSKGASEELKIADDKGLRIIDFKNGKLEA